jgi:hypothetical protein
MSEFVECDKCADYCSDCECTDKESGKSEERLRWALRYILCHPQISPQILSEEWKISIDDAIEICSKNFSTCTVEFGFGKGKYSFENLEKDIFDKLINFMDK